MNEFRDELDRIFNRFDGVDALDIFLIAVLIYGAFLLLRGTAAIALLRGAALILIVIVILAEVLNLQVLDFVIRNSITGLIIAVPVIFQPEIRRALERVGRTGFGVLGRGEHDELVVTLSESAFELARQRHGALIVIERETGLQPYVDTGVMIDAEPSMELLTGLFYPNSPLHDGAVIVHGKRVVAAGCTLPLSEMRLPGEMGMRHQAGLGVTEETDAISLVVSEETGAVAVAADGRLYTRMDEARLRGLLSRLLSPTSRDGASAA